MLQESAVTKSVHSYTLTQNLRLKIARGMIGAFVNMVSLYTFEIYKLQTCLNCHILKLNLVSITYYLYLFVLIS